MKKYLSIILLSMVAFACQKEEATPANIFGFTNFELAKEKLGKYADIFAESNGSIYFDAISSNNSSEVDWDIFARFNPTFSKDRTNGGIYQIDDIKLVAGADGEYSIENKPNLSEVEQGQLISKFYGKTIGLSLVRDGQEIFKESLYVPEKIQINNFGTDKLLPNTGLYSASRKGVNLSWNADANNKEGIVAYLVWTGDKIDLAGDQQGKAGFKEVAAKFDDKGKAFLPSEYFTDVPKNAIFTIFTIRGNIVLKEGKDKLLYKMFNKSQHKLSFVMVD